MKRIFLAIFILLSIAAKAQTPGTTYIVPSIASMKIYFGNANIMYVSGTNEFYSICSICVANDSTIYAGAGGRKWLKVTDAAQLSLIQKNIDSITVHNTRILSNNSAIAAEITNRTNADALLLPKSDSTLANRITNNTTNIAINAAAISTETTARQNADIVSGSVTGTTSKNIALTKGDGSAINIPFTDVSGGGSTATPSYYVSNVGSNSNTGTDINAPKATISSVLSSASSGQTINLRRGSVFPEKVTLQGTGLRQLTFDGYTVTGGSTFPIVSEVTEYNSGWTLVNSNTYQQSVVNNNLGTIGNYNSMPVIETDTALAKIAPYTARKALKWVATQAEVESTPGTYTTTSTVNGGTATISMHPTSGAPGSNKYRYEIVTGGNPFYAQNQTLTGNATNITYKNIEYRGAGNGYGFAGGDTTHIIQGIFPEGFSIHKSVIYGGTYNKILTLGETKGIAEFAHVFYRPTGLRLPNRFYNSVSFDVAHLLYSHNSGGVNNNLLDIDNGWSWADSTYINYLFSTATTDSGVINNFYTDRHGTIYYGNPISLIVKNSVFNNASNIQFLPQSTSATNFSTDNIFVKTNGNDYNSNFVGGVIPGIFTNTSTATVTEANHSIFHLRSIATTNAFTLFAAKKAYYNIIIADNAGTTVFGNNNTTPDYDYNIYVNLRGGFNWTKTGSGTQNSFPVLQGTGTDAHSKYIDLSSDPRGLKALFVSPETGDYSFVQGGWGDTARSVGAGMRTPVRRFPARPTYEQAADWIKQDKVPLVSSLFVDGGSIPNVVTFREGTNKVQGDASEMTNVTSTTGWNKLGNSINAATDFLGTTNNTSLRFRTNNIERGFWDSTGVLVIPAASKIQFHSNPGTGMTMGYNGQNEIRYPGNSFNIQSGATNMLYFSGTTLVEYGYGGTITNFNPIKNYLHFSRSSPNTDIFVPAFASRNLRLFTEDYAFTGLTTAPANVYLYAGKNSTTSVNGNTVLAHDGTTAKGNVGIGTITTNPTAQLQVDNTGKGILIPRMTKAQRDAINQIISITVSGTNTTPYTAANGFTITGGSPLTNALISGNLAGSNVASFNIIYAGTNYTSTPTVTSTTGAGQTFTPVLGVPQGMLVFVTDNGGYLSWYNGGWQKVSPTADP